MKISDKEVEIMQVAGRFVAKRWKGRLPGCDFEDIEQMVVTACLESLDNFDPSRSSFLTFCVVVGTREAIDCFRSYYGQHGQFTTREHTYTDAYPYKRPDFVAPVTPRTIEIRDELQKQLCSLSPTQRLVLYLRYGADFNQEETASVIGIGRSTLCDTETALRDWFGLPRPALIMTMGGRKVAHRRFYRHRR